MSDSTKAKIDEQLLGKWITTDSTEIVTYEVLQFNDNEYILLSKEDGKNEIGLMRAFITKIKNHNFLNMQFVYPPDNGKGWIFVNFKTKNDTLLLNTVEQDIFKQSKDIFGKGQNELIFTSSHSLYNFISENLNNNKLYGKGEESILKRIK